VIATAHAAARHNRCMLLPSEMNWAGRIITRRERLLPPVDM